MTTPATVAPLRTSISPTCFRSGRRDSPYFVTRTVASAQLREQRAALRDEEGRTGGDDVVKFAAPNEQEGVEGGGGEHVVGEEEGISAGDYVETIETCDRLRDAQRSGEIGEIVRQAYALRGRGCYDPLPSTSASTNRTRTRRAAPARWRGLRGCRAGSFAGVLLATSTVDVRGDAGGSRSYAVLTSISRQPCRVSGSMGVRLRLERAGDVKLAFGGRPRGASSAGVH